MLWCIGAQSYRQSCRRASDSQIRTLLRNVQRASASGYDTAPMVAEHHVRSVAASRGASPPLAAGVARRGRHRRGAQSSGDKWWPGYGGGADNSRYFASRQINKSNVSRLQVAWTYPYGDTGFAPDRRARRDLRPRPQRIARRRRREDRQGAVGPRKHERHDQPRHELLGERRRPRPAPDLRDEQPAPGAGCEDRQAHHVVRHQRRRRPARRHRRPRSGDDRQHPVELRPARSSRT